MEQRFRLQAEGVLFSGSRVRMSECEFKFGRSSGKKRVSAQKRRN